jgi:hypothetical protein
MYAAKDLRKPSCGYIQLDGGQENEGWGVTLLLLHLHLNEHAMS